MNGEGGSFVRFILVLIKLKCRYIDLSDSVLTSLYLLSVSAPCKCDNVTKAR